MLTTTFSDVVYRLFEQMKSFNRIVAGAFAGGVACGLMAAATTFAMDVLNHSSANVMDYVVRLNDGSDETEHFNKQKRL